MLYLRLTPDGRDFAAELSRHWSRSAPSGDESAAAAKLQSLGGQIGRLPPEEHVVSLNFTDKKLGDDGYRLLGKCPRLQSAVFIKCDLTDQRMRFFAGLTDLTSLSIIDAPAVTDEGIKQIASLRQLVGLLVNGTSVGDAGLATIGKLSELANLDLSNTQVTDAGMPSLNGLAKVQWLLLANTAVGDDGVAKLKGLSALRQITLKGSKVSEKGRSKLMEMYPGLKIDWTAEKQD